MEIQFLFLHLSKWKNCNLSAWFHIYCSTHVVVVDDREVASMEVESLGSLSSYILICLDLLRWSNGRTCARSWQSWVFFWDLILAKTPDLVSNVEVLTDHFNSDHFPVSFDIKLLSGRPRKSVPRTKKKLIRQTLLNWMNYWSTFHGIVLFWKRMWIFVLKESMT